MALRIEWMNSCWNVWLKWEKGLTTHWVAKVLKRFEMVCKYSKWIKVVDSSWNILKNYFM